MAFVPPSSGQNLEVALDDMPLVCAALTKVLQGTTPFMARVETTVTYASNPKPTTASGVAAWQSGTFRWDVDMGRVNGPLVSPQIASSVNHLKLGPVFLLARSRPDKANIILNGAKAHLEIDLPRLEAARDAKRPAPVEVTLGAEKCTKEVASYLAGKRRVTAWTWRSADKEKLPVQMRVEFDGAVIQIQFRDVRSRKLPPAQFEIPGGFARYSYFEDLLQSLLVERMRSKLGLSPD